MAMMVVDGNSLQAKSHWQSKSVGVVRLSLALVNRVNSCDGCRQ